MLKSVFVLHTFFRFRRVLAIMIKTNFSYGNTDKEITTERDFAEEELELETTFFRRFRLAYEN
jgi:hypothetical protein